MWVLGWVFYVFDVNGEFVVFFKFFVGFFDFIGEDCFDVFFFGY